MSKPITKAALKSAAQDMLASIEAMPESRVLKFGTEAIVDSFGMRDSRLHMDHLDAIRKATLHRFAREVADELIRSGALKMTETLEDDHRRYARVLRITGSVSVC